jgi:hypothetical protein
MLCQGYCNPEERGNLFPLVSLRAQSGNPLGKNAFIFMRWLRSTRNDMVFNEFILEEKNYKNRKCCEGLINSFS